MKNYESRLSKLEGRFGSSSIIMLLIRKDQTLGEVIADFNQIHKTNLKERTVKKWPNFPKIDQTIKLSPNFDIDIYLSDLVYHDKGEIILKNFEYNFVN